MNYKEITYNQTAKVKRIVEMPNSQANAIKRPENTIQSSAKDK